MRRARSIKVRLSLVFLLSVSAGDRSRVRSLGSLSYVNDASSQIRDRWLPSTRVLGDLNNLHDGLTARPRRPCSARRTPASRRRVERQMAGLDRDIPLRSAPIGRFVTMPPRMRCTADSRRNGANIGPSARSNAGRRGIGLTATVALSDTSSECSPIANFASARDASEALGSRLWSQARQRLVITIFLAGTAWPARWCTSPGPSRRPWWILRRACTGWPRARPASRSWEHNDRTKSAKWRAPSSCFATMRSIWRRIATPWRSRPPCCRRSSPRSSEYAAAAKFRVNGIARVPHATGHHRWPRPTVHLDAGSIDTR